RGGEPALPVEREAVRSDHREFFVERVAFLFAVGLDEAYAPDVPAGVAAVVEMDRDLAVGRPSIDDVGGDVAEEEIAALALLDPKRAFGEAEAAFYQLQLRVGRDERIERGIDRDHGLFGNLWRRRKRRGRQQRDRSGKKYFHHCVLRRDRK